MHATIIPSKNGYIMPIHQVAVLIHHSEPSLPKKLSQLPDHHACVAVATRRGATNDATITPPTPFYRDDFSHCAQIILLCNHRHRKIDMHVCIVQGR